MANNDFSLDDLTTPLTVEDVKASVYAVLAALGVNTTVWKPGAVVRTMIAALAIVVASLSQLVALVARGGFLDLAEGAWLRLKARYDYGVEWNGPTFATGTVTLNNSGGGIYSFGPDEIIFVNTVTGKEYRNVGAVEIGALQTGIQVAIRAVEAGSASNALPGEIAFGSPVLGVEIEQNAAVIGADGEDDLELRERARDRLGALSPNGPRDAYAYIAKSATRADGTPIGITRVAARPDGRGGINVYVATSTGGVTGTAGDLDTDLGRVDDAIQRNAVPLCVTASVHSATSQVIDITATVWLFATANLTAAQVIEAIEAEIIEFFRGVPIGGYDANEGGGFVYHSALEGIITRARRDVKDPASPRLGVFRTVLSEPSGDVAIGPAAVPTLGTLNITVNIVASS